MLHTALKLAMLYPALLAFAQWTWTGEQTGLGGAPLLVAGIDGLLRWALFVLVLAGLAGAVVRFATFLRLRYVFFVIWGGAGGAAFIAVPHHLFQYHPAFFFLSVVGGLPLLRYVISLPVMIISGALFIGLAEDLGPVLAIGVVVAAITCFEQAFQLASRRGMLGVAYPALMVATLGIAVVMATISTGLTRNAFSANIFLVFGVFPLVNALFDWASYALTLTLLRAGFRRKGPAILGLALLDIIAAALLFLGLGVVLITLVALMNRGGGDAFDLWGMFRDLYGPEVWTQQFWIVGMIFSTLVPTCVHLVIAALGIATWMPEGLRRRLREGLAAHENGPRFVVAAAGAGAACTLYLCAVTATLGAAGWALWEFAGHVGALYRDVLLDYAITVTTWLAPG